MPSWCDGLCYLTTRSRGHRYRIGRASGRCGGARGSAYLTSSKLFYCKCDTPEFAGFAQTSDWISQSCRIAIQECVRDSYPGRSYCRTAFLARETLHHPRAAPTLRSCQRPRWGAPIQGFAELPQSWGAQATWRQAPDSSRHCDRIPTPPIEIGYRWLLHHLWLRTTKFRFHEVASWGFPPSFCYAFLLLFLSPLFFLFLSQSLCEC